MILEKDGQVIIFPPAVTFTRPFNNLNVYTAGPANSVSFYVAAFGNALYTRNLSVKFYNNVLFDDTPMNYFSIVKKQIDNLPISSYYSKSDHSFGFQ